MSPVHGIGARGERIASRWLRRRGWRVLHRNHRVGIDEIDIVAESPDGRLIGCIEVKTASRGTRTSPLRRVDGRKQHRLLRSARRVGSVYPDHLIRIDIMTVEVGGWHWPRVRHLPGAVQHTSGRMPRR